LGRERIKYISIREIKEAPKKQDDKSKPNVFLVSTAERSFILQAPSETERDGWIQAIEKARQQLLGLNPQLRM
jgi:hypothetical protein